MQLLRLFLSYVLFRRKLVVLKISHQDSIHIRPELLSSMKTAFLHEFVAYRSQFCYIVNGNLPVKWVGPAKLLQNINI